MEQINIVYICDANYIMQTKVSITSLIAHNRVERCNIYIIAIDLSMREQRVLLEMKTEREDVLIIPATNNFSNMGYDHEYVSTAALYKFKLPSILKDLDSVLYIDGDTLIYEGYEKLFDANIDNYYVAAVQDMEMTLEKKCNQKIGHDKYFNSGVMYLNLKKMREDHIEELLFEYKRKDLDKTFMDQNSYNAILGKKVLWLSPRYNVIISSWHKYSVDEIARFYEKSATEITDIFEYPKILHLAGVTKPWKNPIICTEWIKYLDLDLLKVCIPNYYQSLLDEIKRLEEKLEKLDERCADSDRQLQYVRNHTFWGVCCRICDRIRGIK